MRVKVCCLRYDIYTIFNWPLPSLVEAVRHENSALHFYTWPAVEIEPQTSNILWGSVFIYIKVTSELRMLNRDHLTPFRRYETWFAALLKTESIPKTIKKLNSFVKWDNTKAMPQRAKLWHLSQNKTQLNLQNNNLRWAVTVLDPICLPVKFGNKRHKTCLLSCGIPQRKEKYLDLNCICVRSQNMDDDHVM